MNPSDIYWVMQADTLLVAAFVCTLIFGIAGAVALFCTLIWKHESCCVNEYRRNQTSPPPWGMWAFSIGLLIVASLFGITRAFMPSTKTLCVMYTVPAIVNNETVRTDLADVYSLGMERLKDIIKEEAEENVDPEY